ncbi:putative tannase [Aspergillus eucalypticola CBS 122712]|uniref:Carboxylic ester hydrolase n=1 Tax=Aspergillus eucalypticola (strain CBS 122712 / IBT 29274) TaxID=1448314 RepID=A0A317UTK2_ASPEC|nr:putative tannase [Aspergillus eucalypticola CBS 122712]PWY64458.1 putative tannase [Aspergillus eucalypticola CBS 122712]
MIRSSLAGFVAAGCIAVVQAASSLSDVCTVAHVQDSLPDDALLGVTIQSSTVTAAAVYNYNDTGSPFFPDTVVSFCNVTFGYSHNGKDDQVLVNYFLPAPAEFKKRYVSQGGGALDIYSGTATIAGGVQYGAVNGGTDGGFGSFSASFDEVVLLDNGTVNLDIVNLFGYQAHYELGVLGRAFTRLFYGMSEQEKLYSYFQACSEGGREAFSQLQRYGDLWDGASVGAPAFRYSFQQVQHLFSNVVEKTIGYNPPLCEMATIVNATINYCDGLDGKNDGVVARTDLCKLKFNLDTLIGNSYECPASGSAPAQKGNITEKGVEVAKEIINGLHDSKGRRVYISYQPTADFHDAQTTYNSETDSWDISIVGLGGEFVTQLLQNLDIENLPSLEGVTYDTLKYWMIEGMQRYQDTLQVNWPDLTPFQASGGKLIHFHGESDSSVPTASSVRYWESVRNTMYPDLDYANSTAAIKDWYRLYLVPGAAHCDWNDEQPNGPWPQTGLQTIIDWVENNIEPVRLNGTVGAGDNAGQIMEICAWPLRPYWTNDGKNLECEYDQASIDTWLYEFDGVPVPVY